MEGLGKSHQAVSFLLLFPALTVQSVCLLIQPVTFTLSRRLLIDFLSLAQQVYNQSWLAKLDFSRLDIMEIISLLH